MICLQQALHVRVTDNLERIWWVPAVSIRSRQRKCTARCRMPYQLGSRSPGGSLSFGLSLHTLTSDFCQGTGRDFSCCKAIPSICRRVLRLQFTTTPVLPLLSLLSGLGDCRERESTLADHLYHNRSASLFGAAPSTASCICLLARSSLPRLLPEPSVASTPEASVHMASRVRQTSKRNSRSSTTFQDRPHSHRLDCSRYGAASPSPVDYADSIDL